MGQKTNATGFRLQVNKDWKSRWFSQGDDYSDNLHQDIKIRRYLFENLRRAGVVKVEIERTSKEIILNLYVVKPGLVIGRGGERITLLKEQIKQFIGQEKLQINVHQVKKNQISARLLAEEIAQQLERRIKYKRALSRVIKKTMDSGLAEGILVAVSGRLDGIQIARTEKKFAGRVPLQTIRANIDYAQVTAQTKYGLLGVKVWLNKRKEDVYAGAS